MMHPFFSVFAATANTVPCTVECTNTEKEMNTDDFATERRALTNALYSALSDKTDDLRRKYYVVEDRPITPKAFVEAIKAGKFKYVDEDTCDDETEWSNWMSPSRGLRFGPDEDTKGYKIAKDKLDKEYGATRLRIEVLPPKEGLEAVEKFRSATVH